MRESGVSLDASSVRPTAPELAEGAKAYRRRLPDVSERRCPSFLGRWAGGLSDRRSVRRWRPWRNFYPNGQGRVDRLGAHGLFRHGRIAGFAVWRTTFRVVSRSSATHGSSPADGQE